MPVSNPVLRSTRMQAFLCILRTLIRNSNAPQPLPFSAHRLHMENGGRLFDCSISRPDMQNRPLNCEGVISVSFLKVRIKCSSLSYPQARETAVTVISVADKRYFACSIR